MPVVLFTVKHNVMFAVARCSVTHGIAVVFCLVRGIGNLQAFFILVVKPS